MALRLLALLGWVVALAVLGGAAWTSAQTQPADGSFVRDAGGTVYAVSGGVRIRLAPQEDAAGMLDTLRDGPAVSSVAELNGAMAMTEPPATPANPAQTLAGQTVTACAEPGGTPFLVEVVRVDWQRSIAGRAAAGNAFWAVIIAGITNLGNNEGGPYRGASPAVRLVDDRGRTFETDFFGERYDMHAEMATAYGLSAPFFAPLRPGITEERALAFQVAPDAQRLMLESIVTPCPGP